MPINITANTVCKFSPCSQSNMDYAVWTIFVFGTKIIILCLSSSQSTTCISPCISHLYMTVYLIIVSIRTWWSTVNIFKCIYIDIWTVLGEQRAACWSLLHISSLFTVLHLRLRSQHAILIILTQLVPFLDFERNDNMILRTAGREPPSSGSAFSQRHSFSGEQCWAPAKSLKGAKGRLCYKRNYSCRPHLSISLPSELASSLMRRRQTRAIAVWGILNLHWQYGLRLYYCSECTVCLFVLSFSLTVLEGLWFESSFIFLNLHQVSFSFDNL